MHGYDKIRKHCCAPKNLNKSLGLVRQIIRAWAAGAVQIGSHLSRRFEIDVAYANFNRKDMPKELQPNSLGP